LLCEYQNAKAMRESFGGGWRSFMRAVTSEPRRYSLWPLIFTAFQVELGEKGKALAELDAAYAARQSDIRLLKIEPLLDRLRPDPRFQELLRKIGLQP